MNNNSKVEENEKNDLDGVILEADKWISVKQPAEETEVEFLFGDLKNLKTLEMFKNMTTLSIQGNRIKSISQLVPHMTPNLEFLSLFENEISDFSGLEKLPKLRSLVLDFNFVESLETLPVTENLKYLSLNENKVSSLKGINPEIVELRLGGCKLKDKNVEELTHLEHLQTLNISGNQIGKITSISKLGKIKSLRRLFLYDVNFGDNPVCSLHNYELIVKLEMMNLEEIDGQSFNAEEKKEKLSSHETYESFFFNKIKFYYSLTKTLSTYISNFVTFYEICKYKQIMFFSKRFKMLDFIEFDKENNFLKKETVDINVLNELRKEKQTALLKLQKCFKSISQTKENRDRIIEEMKELNDFSIFKFSHK